jgi:hypothetical protein
LPILRFLPKNQRPRQRQMNSSQQQSSPPVHGRQLTPTGREESKVERLSEEKKEPLAALSGIEPR